MIDLLGAEKETFKVQSQFQSQRTICPVANVYLGEQGDDGGRNNDVQDDETDYGDVDHKLDGNSNVYSDNNGDCNDKDGGGGDCGGDRANGDDDSDCGDI